MTSASPDGKPSGKITIAFFKCDRLKEESIEKHGEYEDVLHNLFEPLVPSHLKLETKSYDVLNKREYPTEAELQHIDTVIISGSFEDDAHEDTLFTMKLAGFLIKLHDEFPRIRMIGICFGLQILARAFGPSKIEPNPKGWEVGSTKMNLTEIGRKLVWGEDEKSLNDVAGLPDHVMMQQIHSDIVTKIPPNFSLLGSSELTPVQGLVSFYEKGKEPPAFTHSHADTMPADPWRSVHIIAFQGHPEWHDEIIVPFIDSYEEDGTYSAEFAEKAREATRKKHDGVRVGKVLLKVLGIA